jgi:hypothetical protein
MVGQQTLGPKFDVAFDCGMRFVDPQYADPADGRSNDWGAHIIPQV